MRKCLPLLFAALCFPACEPPAKESGGQLYVGANFITMEPGTSPEAMLVKDGRIADLGTASELSRLAPTARRIDLTGKTVIPGVVDSHVHVRELGMDAIKVDLVGVETIEEIVERIREQRPNAAAGEWIIGQGWDEGAFADYSGDGPTYGGYPTTAAISAAFPDNPIALESLHGFGAMANQAAMQKVGISRATPDPEGGTILRDEDGEPTGVLLTLAQALLFDHVPEPTPAQREAAIIAGLSEMGRAGVTSVHEAGMEAEDVAAFRALADRGELPIRVFGMLNGNDADLMADWFASGPLDDPDDWLDIGGIKVFYDGSLGSRTAMMMAPYSDRPDSAKPTARIHLNAVDALSIKAIETGFQMAVHAIGDEANDCIIANYELRLAPADYDHRWRIEHAQVVAPDFAQRTARLGVIASMQPSHAMGDSDWAEDRVGAERIRHAYAWDSFAKAGVPIIFNSDLPGEPRTPMETLHFAVTRTKLDGSPEGGWYAGEALSREASLRAMTVDGAHAAFQDEAIGSLRSGKWADFVVLSGDPMSAPDIREITVEATYVAGRRLVD